MKKSVNATIDTLIRWKSIYSLIGYTEDLEIINSTIDIGSQYANEKTFSALTTTSAKSYMNLINKETNTNLFVLKEGEKMYWEGYYDIYPTVSDTQ